jgi:protease-4
MKNKVVLFSLIGCCVLFLGIIGLLLVISLLFSGSSNSDFAISDNRIAVIEINGTIDDSDKINGLIKKARDNSSVKAIVLRINSPGGMVGASQEIYQEVTTARGDGMVIVSSMADLGASGAYYIACGTDKIVANPGTLTGSVGVIMNFMNWQGLMNNKLGLQFYNIKSGKFKDSGTPNRPMTDEEKQYMQGVIDNVYGQFLGVVIKSRENNIRDILSRKKMEEVTAADTTVSLKSKDISKIRSEITYAEISTYVKQYAEGNIFTGQQAMDAGMIDSLGNFNTAVDVAAKLAGIGDKKKYKLLYLKPREAGLFEKVFGETAQALNPIKNNHMSMQYILP